MSAFSDRPNPARPNLGTRTAALLDKELARNAGGQDIASRPVDQRPTVTVEKVGDFLEVDFRRLFVWLRSGLLIACILAFVGAVIGGSYTLLSTPRYTVGTDVLINPQNLQVVPNDLYAPPGQVDGQLLTAGSKLRVLTSGNVLARVVDMLNLQDDPEFYDPTPRFSLRSLLGSKVDTGASDPKTSAVESLSKHVGATADDKSFVATLTVSARATDKAIRISQAIITAFQQELATAGADGAMRAASSLGNRLAQLKSDVQAADEKVEAYKRAHKLSSSDGQLVSGQTMTQLNGQLGDAQARVIAAKASYDALLANGANASNSDPVASAALVALRNKAGDLQAQLDSQSSTLGPRHPAIARLKAQLAAADAQLNAELSRTISTAKSALYNANAALTALKNQMEGLKGTSFNDGEAQVALRELERDATAKTAIYENFLSRSKQLSESEQIDTSNVRVISTALPPAGRSWPPSAVVTTAAGAMAGFLVGMMIALCLGIAGDMRQPAQRGATRP
jgi:polysaccharide biosynthesis transport protein